MNQQIYYRLITLWALCEGMLGGIIHGFNLPISGLIVGGAAVILICLIGFYTEDKSAIMKATILVCVFKLMLSPQSPLPAYMAVMFQGLTGSLFFWNKKFYKTSCFLFAVLALFESGVQRILVMTLLFGMNFWKAVNSFISSLTHQSSVTNYSLYIVSGYVLLHIVAGAVVGWFAGRIPGRIESLSRRGNYLIKPDEQKDHEPLQKQSRRRSKFRRGIIVIWILLFVLFLQSQLGIGGPILTGNETLQIIIRSLLILLTWFFIVSPLILMLLKQWLLKQKEKSEREISTILELLPATRFLLKKSWEISATHKGLKRLNEFSKIVLVNSLHQPKD